MSSRQVLDHTSSLIGHDNPYGVYPSLVLPLMEVGNKKCLAILKKDFKLHCIFLSKENLHKKKETLIKYNKKEYKKLITDFDPERERLFAIDKDHVLKYKLKRSEQFFRHIIDKYHLLDFDPGLTLSLAKEINDLSLIKASVLACGERYKNDPDELKFWYDTVTQDLHDLPDTFDKLKKNTKLDQSETTVSTRHTPERTVANNLGSNYNTPLPLNNRTSIVSDSSIARNWLLVDASDLVLGRLASRLAHVLRGKHKPEYSPHQDHGDYVVVINAKKIILTGNKLDKKRYYKHSGFPGGLKSKSARELLELKPQKCYYGSS